MLLSEAIAQFLREGQFSPETVRNYKKFLTYFLDYVTNISLNRVTIKKIRQYRNWLLENLTKNMGWCVTSSLRSFIKWAYENELCGIDPRRIVLIKNNLGSWGAISASDFEKVSKTITLHGKYNRLIPARNKALLMFLWSTGVRAKELLAIKTADLNLQDGIVHLTYTKGDHPAPVYLTERCIKYLKLYLEKYHGEYLFPMTQVNLNTLIRNLGKRAGVKLHCHMIRKGMASAMIMRGADIASVSKILRHKNISTTSEYLKLPDEFVKRTHDRYLDDCREFKLNETKNGIKQWEISGWAKKGEVEKIKRSIKKAMNEAMR